MTTEPTRDQRVKEQAKLVFTTGKMIRDRIFKVQMAGIHADGRGRHLKDLSMAQMHMLMLIRSRETVSVKDLSRLLFVSPPSASAMVERLVERGFLVRNRSRQDRRRVEISLTGKARTIMNEIEQRAFSTFVDLVEQLGPEATGQWCSVLEKIQAILKTDGEP